MSADDCIPCHLGPEANAFRFSGESRASPHDQVPFRRVSLTNGSTFDLYDTSGSQVRILVTQSNSDMHSRPCIKLRIKGPLSYPDPLPRSSPLQGIDPRAGLPKLRRSWVDRRATDANPTQMYYAKAGVVTEEMAFVAARESMDPEYVRSEVCDQQSLRLRVC